MLRLVVGALWNHLALMNLHVCLDFGLMLRQVPEVMYLGHILAELVGRVSKLPYNQVVLERICSFSHCNFLRKLW